MGGEVNVNAVDMLESQYREMEELFAKLERADRGDRKQRLFTLIADRLAVQASIAKEAFQPAVKAKRTEDLLLESLEELLGIKRVLADLIDLDASDETFEARSFSPSASLSRAVGQS